MNHASYEMTDKCYEVPIDDDHVYAEVDAVTNNTEYDYAYIEQQNVPTQSTEYDYAYIRTAANVPTQSHAIHMTTSSQPTTNQANETLRQEKTSQPSCIKRHKIKFAIILAVVLTALVLTAVFVTVLMVVKSNDDSGRLKI